ncbi:MAG: hypothetical protein QW514_09400 [Thermoprotei archaeon]
MCGENYFENLIGYVDSHSEFFSGEWARFEETFKEAVNPANPEEGYLTWLKTIAKYHIDEETGSPYWIHKAKNNGITPGKIDSTQTIEELVGLLGDSDIETLKAENGYTEHYKPRKISVEKLYKSSSSGTTGEPKTVYHTHQSLTVSAINEYTGIKAQYDHKELRGRTLLASGPLGAYQEEHRVLAHLLEMEYVENGFETRGLKLLPPQEIQKALSKPMEKIYQHLQRGIGLMTATSETLERLPEQLLRNAKLIKLSGTKINMELVGQLKTKSINTIPMYGHYAGKSSIGFYSSEEIAYYPSYPLTQYLLNQKQRSRIKLIVAQPELLLISSEDYAHTAPTNKYFKPLSGIANPTRT